MNADEFKNIIQKAIDTYGVDSQIKMAIEECSELINALTKAWRGRSTNEDIITEIADVIIMCEQLAVIFGRDKVGREITRKVERLAERLG